MRIANCLSGILLFSTASLAFATPPDTTGAQTAADFFLGACLSAVDDLSALDQRAAHDNWTSLLNPNQPQNEPIKVHGIWRVAGQNGATYIVAAAVGPHNKASCQVAFSNPKPGRDAFVAALGKTVTLKSTIDNASPDLRTEMFQIVSALPKNLTLQMASSGGAVLKATILGPP